MISLAFRRHDSRIGARIIRWWTRGNYSHVALCLFREGSYVNFYEATAAGGVERHWLNINPREWDFVDIDWLDPDDILDRLDAERGTGYDWLGLLCSQVLPRSREHPEKWFCSELAAFALGLSHAQRYSPAHLHALACDLVRLKAL